jgi:hypothetical protein
MTNARALTQSFHMDVLSSEQELNHDLGMFGLCTYSTDNANYMLFPAVPYCANLRYALYNVYQQIAQFENVH